MSSVWERMVAEELSWSQPATPPRVLASVEPSPIVSARQGIDDLTKCMNSTQFRLFSPDSKLRVLRHIVSRPTLSNEFMEDFEDLTPRVKGSRSKKQRRFKGLSVTTRVDLVIGMQTPAAKKPKTSMSELQLAAKATLEAGRVASLGGKPDLPVPMLDWLYPVQELDASAVKLSTESLIKVLFLLLIRCLLSCIRE